MNFLTSLFLFMIIVALFKPKKKYDDKGYKGDNYIVLSELEKDYGGHKHVPEDNGGESIYDYEEAEGGEDW